MNLGEGGIRIDARMLGYSGIGVVLENIASRWIRDKPRTHFQVLVHPANPNRPEWLGSGNVQTSLWPVPIYSIREHFQRPPASRLPVVATWCPHYNLSLALGGNVLTTIHDVLHLDRSIQRRSLQQRIYAEVMFRWVRSRAKAISFDSRFTADEFSRMVGPSRSPSRVVPLGVEAVWFEPLRDAAPLLEKPYVVFVGNAFPHKNLARLIEAMSILRQDVDVDLVVVGKNQGLKNLDVEALALAEARSDWVHIVGKVPFDELRRWVAGARAMAFPTLYEGFGLPPLEALASGVPVMVSDIPAMREIYDGIGFFADPMDPQDISRAIRACIDAPRDAEKCRGFARRFDWDASAKAMAELLMGHVQAGETARV